MPSGIPKGKMKLSDYELKAKIKARQSTPEYKAKQKARESTPEYKAKQKARQSTPEYKAKRKARESTPEYKAKRKARQSTPEYKDKRRNWNKNYSQKPEAQFQKKESRKNLRMMILSHYSKIISNSSVPCCDCCREFEIEFLTLDHIAGRKQMDSEPKLRKMGYSSKLEGDGLLWWIKKNNFPEGFQVLCQNCNFAKGKRGNNNICPHETKRKEETFAMMEEQSSFEV
jgi:hypothetical protein